MKKGLLCCALMLGCEPGKVSDGNDDAMIPTQVVFNNDGTIMFIANHSNNADDYINYWDLSTPFDISTATLDNRLSLDSTGIVEQRLNSIAFNCVVVKKIIKKNNLDIILQSIHHQPIMKFQ